jgi:hypothetical protein
VRQSDDESDDKCGIIKSVVLNCEVLKRKLKKTTYRQMTVIVTVMGMGLLKACFAKSCLAAKET